MTRCGYKIFKKVRCRLDALPEEEYCYWHKKEDGKEPTEEQLEELRRDGILNAYLRGADLCEANLRGAKLSGVDLRGATLLLANLRETELIGSRLQGADLSSADLRDAVLPAELFGSPSGLQGAKLVNANLRGTELTRSELQGADLSSAYLQGAKLSNANLQGAYLHNARFDSETVLDKSILVGANLFHSYFDEAKSFRNATVFQNGGDREINEIMGDALGDPKFMLLDVKDLDVTNRGLAATLRKKGLIRYDRDGKKIIFFNRSSGGVIENPENGLRHRSPIRVDELNDLILKDGEMQSEFLYDGSRANLYDASYEVYNNLYNFYIANGNLDKAAHVHYRRGEVHRKLKWAGGGFWNRAESIFDRVILCWFTGYGEKIERPIFWSGVTIAVFAALFWLSDGIVKNVNGTVMCVNDTVMHVNGTQVAPDWWDYFYHSITTFTSLGYSNIQPNLASGHWYWPQVLVAFESGLGILMTALIIFVVTYQVSR